MNERRLLPVLLVILLMAGCESGSTETSTGALADAAVGPRDPCAAAIADMGIERCPEMVALATARLGWFHWPISTTTFRRDLCPPNARCLLPLPDRGYVIFTFAVGDPVVVRVAPVMDEHGAEGAVLVADEPEPLPDWLLQEIARVQRIGER